MKKDSQTGRDIKGRQILKPLSNSWRQQQHWSTQGQAMAPHFQGLKTASLTLKTDNAQLKMQDTLLHQDFPHEQHSLK